MTANVSSNLDGMTNCSNLILTSEQICQNIDLFEGRGIKEWWYTNWASNADADRREYLLSKFPGANYLRMVILKLAWAIPMPQVQANTKTVKSEARVKEINDKIKQLQERKVWEGEMDFWAARPWWTAFILVTGSTFVKLPKLADGKGGQVLPERMPPQNSELMLDTERLKVVAGHRFKYQVGDGSFSEQPSGRWVTESIYPGKWVTEGDPKAPEGKVQTFSWPWAPVAHMQWEIRMDHPRGLPLFERLKEKSLHVYSAQMDRVEASRYSGAKMFVRKNAKGSLPRARGGAVIDIHTTDPTKEADFYSLDTATDDQLLRNGYLDALRELYNEAFVSFPMDENSGSSQPQSGKALMQLTKDGKSYALAFTTAEASFLIDLFMKCIVIEGGDVKPEELMVGYDMADEPDPTERREDARLWFGEGFPKRGLMAMGVEEDQVEGILEEREEQRSSNMLGFGFGEQDPNKGAKDKKGKLDDEDKPAEGEDRGEKA